MIDQLQQGEVRAFIVSLLIMMASSTAYSEPDADDSPLFLNQSTLHVRIEGPLSTLIRERSDSEYLDGKMSYIDDAGTMHELNLKFRTRGNYRRQRRTCWFPPIRLNVEKKQVENTEFSGQNILKLVSHCSLSNQKFQQYVLKEYLAYKILELHTPYSFRTRLLKINWVDTEKNNIAVERYGFIIEHKKQLSVRLGVKVADIQGTQHSRLDIEQASIASVFQYLIGNTDFSLVRGTPEESCCHNGILVSKDDTAFFPIPYDFDFAGIVDAPYAEPNPKFKIRSVTTRLYRGHCSVNSALRTTIPLFAQKRDAVLELVQTQEGLTDRERKRTLKFIGKFYSQIADQRKMERRFSRECF